MKRTLTRENNTTPGPTTRIGLHTLVKVIQRERVESFFLKPTNILLTRR